MKAKTKEAVTEFTHALQRLPRIIDNLDQITQKIAADNQVKKKNKECKNKILKLSAALLVGYFLGQMLIL